MYINTSYIYIHTWQKTSSLISAQRVRFKAVKAGVFASALSGAGARKGEDELAEAVLMISNCSCARTNV